MSDTRPDPIRLLPAQAERVETGPVQFGDDWPGVFIRGDNAFGYAGVLDAALRRADDGMERVMLQSLRDVLSASDLTGLSKRAPIAAPLVQPVASAEPKAWLHDDGERVIPAHTKATALRDGGASASSVAAFRTALVIAAPATSPAEPDIYQFRVKDGGALYGGWNSTDRGGYEKARAQPEIDKVRSLYAAPVAQAAPIELDQKCLPNGVMFDAFGNERVRYVRVTYDGSHLILTPAGAEAWKREAEASAASIGQTDPHAYSDVYLSKEEADALPEFDGF
jgi:hypothetical protein